MRKKRGRLNATYSAVCLNGKLNITMLCTVHTSFIILLCLESQQKGMVMHMSIKNYAMEFIKHHSAVNELFYVVGSVAVRAIGFFIRPDDKLILFNSFGGKKYDDSPKAIYEAMKKDPRFSKYRLLWAFHEPEKFPEVTDKIRTDTPKYFVTALKARVWITNSSMQRGLKFCGKHTFRFNSWHGTPMKRMGLDKKSQENDPRYRENFDDIMLAQSNYEIEKMSEATHMPRNHFRMYGLPRNDILASITVEQIERARQGIGIPADKKVILYAPTFREYWLDDMSRCTLNIPIDFTQWNKLLGDEYVVLFRAHYEVAKHTALPKDGGWIDVSGYPCLNDLMIASDILISDYSSILFDFSIMEKPMFQFAYDYDEYNQKRGLYFDVRKELSGSDSSHKLAYLIATMDENVERAKCRAFRNKYVEEYGMAARKSVDLIAAELRV